ncbi:hypothetical protein AAKU64_004422 [Undibacterium sp. GrIS 1.8]
MTTNPCRVRYFPLGGLLPRPEPDGLPVLLGALVKWSTMVISP